MSLVACVRMPKDLEGAAAALGRAVGLTLAEARLRLAPEPPAILASLAPEAAARLVSELRGAGVAALVVEGAESLPGQRIVARSATLGPSGASFQPRTGAALALPWAEVSALFRGASTVRSETATLQQTSKFSLSTAIATQGLKMSRKEDRTVRSQQEETEQVILLYGKGGQRVVLRERELDFSFLGAAMQPTRIANMGALAKLLKEKAPGAFYDERLLRLGRRPLPLFVGGETHVQMGKTSQTLLDTSGGLEVLGTALWRAVEERLLP
ncbi:hypothetical protein POL68_06010 [Stigmatella sp. ncwal1]|uniref:Uncharacterized protein n=1 Tax=Stigmatella ashevillensis TaxID=2995309 RepID=A0ABT5D2Y7_9BACT|nr:hypothetical protein [Stigmatella ashevillena]MDC0708019.1 hypothetical protein [Stigmatella ashevillena]